MVKSSSSLHPAYLPARCGTTPGVSTNVHVIVTGNRRRVPGRTGELLAGLRERSVWSLNQIPESLLGPRHLFLRRISDFTCCNPVVQSSGAKEFFLSCLRMPS